MSKAGELAIDALADANREIATLRQQVEGLTEALEKSRNQSAVATQMSKIYTELAADLEAQLAAAEKRAQDAEAERDGLREAATQLEAARMPYKDKGITEIPYDAWQSFALAVWGYHPAPPATRREN